MSQLLGMNCAAPAEEYATSLFRKFCYNNNNRRNRRGLLKNNGDDNNDLHSSSHGCWGLAVYQGRGLRTFLDSKPAEESPIAEMVSQCLSMNTRNMMVAKRGDDEVSLENIHPFSRELWGIQWTFCHNGKVPKFSSLSSINSSSNGRCHQQQRYPPTLGRKMMKTNTKRTATTKHRYHAVGDTDSEAIFCAIMNALRSEYDSLPTLPVLHKFLKKLCDEIVFNGNSNEDEQTNFNFLLGCGQCTMFAYSSPSSSRPSDGSKVGLHYSIRESSSDDDSSFSSAELSDDSSSNDDYNHYYQDPIAVITTRPYFSTNGDSWKEFRRGELMMFDKGIPYSLHSEMMCVAPAVEQQQQRKGSFIDNNSNNNKCLRKQIALKKIAAATTTAESSGSVVVDDYTQRIPTSPTTVATTATYLDSTIINAAAAATKITSLPIAFAS